MNEKGKMVEAALFMAPKAMNVQELMPVLGEENYTAAKQAIMDCVQEFNARDSALHIVLVEDSFQMRLRPEYEANVKHLAAKTIFHPGIMKTLALIAFKQPISQSLVIKYRNNKAYDHIHRLVEEGFIAREPKGRSFVLRTTKKFLEHFGDSIVKQKKLQGQQARQQAAQPAQ
ncbi:MAG: SMC-Scp complex subunit ScpB [Candidatus Diapherotrites archaeon]|nr:SMC-Scp complex subunit ScpB [Candidatus Diapherotrites archaeon]